jgi:hypothetical protein
LKKPPTTYLSAPTATGVQSTLEVRVNGVRWDEVPSLYGAEPDQTAYTTRIDDDARMQLTFGDGVQGARLPTGSVNVAARYRSGIGPDGEVDAGTLTMLRAMPLGLRGVTNAVGGGAEGPEQLKDAVAMHRSTLLTFERVVSLLDYENYARPTRASARRAATCCGRRGAAVFLTVAGAPAGAGATCWPTRYRSPARATRRSVSKRPPSAALLSLGARVAIDPRYRFATCRRR